MLDLLRGEVGGKDHFSTAVRSSVRRIKKALGGYYTLRVDTLAGQLHAARRDRRRIIKVAQGFINDLAGHFSLISGGSTVVFDQGVRPWALGRTVFFGECITFVCMRDIRDQMIERARHALDNDGFQETMRSQVTKMERFLASRPEKGNLKQVWFEDIVLHLPTRRDVLATAGLEANARVGKKFNPLASRRNIGLYRIRPDLSPEITKQNGALIYPGKGAGQRLLTLIHDLPRYVISARSNAAGAISKTGRLEGL